ncbi:MAG: hypothetical protein IPP12_09735 [Nitrospira sp.]|nr:hypothetical protein [Nitrospira sp.]
MPNNRQVSIQDMPPFHRARNRASQAQTSINGTKAQALQRSLWGINLYPTRAASEWIEFDSMINVRPSGGNRSRHVERAETREAVTDIVNRLVES